MKSHWILCIFILISNMSFASFPVINNESVVESVTAPNRLDTFDIIGWIALGCLALGDILIALLLGVFLIQIISEQYGHA